MSDREDKYSDMPLSASGAYNRAYSEALTGDCDIDRFIPPQDRMEWIYDIIDLYRGMKTDAFGTRDYAGFGKAVSERIENSLDFYADSEAANA